MENKNIRIDEIEKLLFDSGLSANEIARSADVYPADVSKLRNKKRKLLNISLATALKYQNYINQLKKENKF